MKKILLLSLLLSTSAWAILTVGWNTVTVTTIPQIIDVSNRHYPMTVSVFPSAGTTATVEFSTTPGAAAAPASARWQVLGTASGISVAQTNTVPSAINALRFTRNSGTGEVVGEINYPQ